MGLINLSCPNFCNLDITNNRCLSRFEIWSIKTIIVNIKGIYLFIFVFIFIFYFILFFFPGTILKSLWRVYYKYTRFK